MLRLRSKKFLGVNCESQRQVRSANTFETIIKRRFTIAICVAKIGKIGRPQAFPICLEAQVAGTLPVWLASSTEFGADTAKQNY